MSALSRQLSQSSIKDSSPVQQRKTIVDNPVPQLPPGASSPRDNPVLLDVAPNTNKYRTPSDKLVLILVGLLRARKDIYRKKDREYLEFFHAASVRVFNIGNHRRSSTGRTTTRPGSTPRIPWD